MSLKQAVPILPSSDFERTTRFFTHFGFTRRGVWPREYLILAAAELELHFFHAPGIDPKTSDFMVYLRAEDTAALYERYAALGFPLGCEGAPRVQGPPDAEGAFAVVDPDGTLLRIGRLKT